MKKLISLILAIVVVILGTVSAVAETAKEAPFTALIPVSKQGLFRVDPDTSSIDLTKCEEVTRQTSVSKYASKGCVIGAKSASDLLLREMRSQVSVWDFKVLDTTKWPEEAKTLDGQELVTWLVSQVTRVVYTGDKVYTTLNVEPFVEGTHKAQAQIWVGTKDSQYWTIYRRTTDGIWTLCTAAKTGGQGGQKPPAEAVPQDEGRDPEEPPEEETPVAVPQDEGRDGDDNGDAGDENPLVADPQDTGRPAEGPEGETTGDDNGDGGYDNPLATPHDQGRDNEPAQETNDDPFATPTDTGRD